MIAQKKNPSNRFLLTLKHIFEKSQQLQSTAQQGLHRSWCSPLPSPLLHPLPGLGRLFLSVHTHDVQVNLVLTPGLLSLLFPLPLVYTCLASFHHLLLRSKLLSWEASLTTVIEVASLPFTFTKSPSFIILLALFIVWNELLFKENLTNLMSISNPPTWNSWREASGSLFSPLTADPSPWMRGKVGQLSEWRLTLLIELG